MGLQHQIVLQNSEIAELFSITEFHHWRAVQLTTSIIPLVTEPALPRKYQ